MKDRGAADSSLAVGVGCREDVAVGDSTLLPTLGGTADTAGTGAGACGGGRGAWDGAASLDDAS